MVIKSRRLRWRGHVARMEEGRSVNKNLTGTTSGKAPLEKPRGRWEDNIRMDLKEIIIIIIIIIIITIILLHMSTDNREMAHCLKNKKSVITAASAEKLKRDFLLPSMPEVLPVWNLEW